MGATITDPSLAAADLAPRDGLLDRLQDYSDARAVAHIVVARTLLRRAREAGGALHLSSEEYEAALAAVTVEDAACVMRAMAGGASWTAGCSFRAARKVLGALEQPLHVAEWNDLEVIGEHRANPGHDRLLDALRGLLDGGAA